jgi:hypothetical protein
MIVVEEEPRAVVVGRLDTPAGRSPWPTPTCPTCRGWGQWQLQQVRRDLAREPGTGGADGRPQHARRAARLVTGYTALARHPTFPVEIPTPSWTHPARGRSGGRRQQRPQLPLSDHRRCGRRRGHGDAEVEGEVLAAMVSEFPRR